MPSFAQIVTILSMLSFVSLLAAMHPKVPTFEAAAVSAAAWFLLLILFAV